MTNFFQRASLGSLAVIAMSCAPSPARPEASVDKPVSEGLCLAEMRAGAIYLVPLNGPQLTRHLSVKDAATLTRGRVSPDGAYIASLRLPHGARAESLVGVASDGKQLWQIHGESLDVPSISPDGTKLAFIEGTELNLYEISSEALNRLGVNAGNPAWSAQGDRVAYDWDGNVHVVDVTTGGISLIGPGTEPSWAPDGKSLAVRTSPDKIELVHLETHTREVFLEEDLVSVPRWSPDGEWITYSYRGGGRWWSLSNAAEPHQIMVRETKSGAERSVGVFYKADPGDFTWVRNRAFCLQ